MTDLQGTNDISMDCQLDRIKNNLEGKAGHVCEGISKLSGVGETLLGCEKHQPFHGLGFWTEYKGSELSTWIHLSLLPDCECHVTSRLLLLPPAFPTMMDCEPSDCKPNKPFLYVAFAGYFVTAMRK